MLAAALTTLPFGLFREVDLLQQPSSIKTTKTTKTTIREEDNADRRWIIGLWESIIERASAREAEARARWGNDARVFDEGFPVRSGQDGGLAGLVQLLAVRMSACSKSKSEANRKRKERNDGHELPELPEEGRDNCSLRVVFLGSALTVGRDNHQNRTYPAHTERVLRSTLGPLLLKIGLRLEVINAAMDHDLAREGPQKSHLCLTNQVGQGADVLSWEFDEIMAASRPAQVRHVICPLPCF